MKVITDLSILEEFVSNIPPLNRNEAYYMALCARSKYDVNLPVNKLFLKKAIVTDLSLFIQKIRSMEVRTPYTYDGKEISQDSLVMYMSVNPRNTRLAAKKTIQRLTDLLYDDGFVNPQSVAIDCIQDSNGKTLYRSFDFDKVSLDETIIEIDKFLSRKKYRILKSKNGFHIQVIIDRLEPHETKTYFNNMKKVKGCDVSTEDMLMAIPGTTQGGFTPYIVQY